MSLDARRVAERLSGCPHVSGLHAGPLGTIVTPTETGPVVGILLHSAMIVLGVVVTSGADESDVAAGIRDRLSAVAEGVPISLSIRRPDAA